MHFFSEQIQKYNADCKPKVGEKLIFAHRKNPDDPLIEEVGTVLSIEYKQNGDQSIVTNVGSHTMKFIMN